MIYRDTQFHQALSQKVSHFWIALIVWFFKTNKQESGTIKLSENVRFMGVFIKRKSASADQREEGAWGWMINKRWDIEFGRPVFQEENVSFFLQFRSIYPFLHPKYFWVLYSEKLCSVCRKMFGHGHVIWLWVEYHWTEAYKMFWYWQMYRIFF